MGLGQKWTQQTHGVEGLCPASTGHGIPERQSSGGWLSMKSAGGGRRTGPKGLVPILQKEHQPVGWLTTEPAALPAHPQQGTSETETVCSVCGKVCSVFCVFVIQERDFQNLSVDVGVLAQGTWTD